MRIGPHPLPVSIPEFNRLSARLQSATETAVVLILYAMLMADEMPALASEAVALRISEKQAGAQTTASKFVTERNNLAAKCAATFVIGAKPPDFRFDVNAVAFAVRRGPLSNAKKRKGTLCSGAVGCITFDLEKDADRGWRATTISPLIDACKQLK